jgi:hypothetical protein
MAGLEPPSAAGEWCSYFGGDDGTASAAGYTTGITVKTEGITGRPAGGAGKTAESAGKIAETAEVIAESAGMITGSAMVERRKL